MKIMTTTQAAIQFLKTIKSLLAKFSQMISEGSGDGSNWSLWPKSSKALPDSFQVTLPDKSFFV